MFGKAPMRAGTVVGRAAAVLVVGVVGATALAATVQASGVPVARAIQTASLKTMEGGPGNVQLDDQITVVNFWASWCAPCKKELPELDAISEAFQGRGVRFMAISIDEDAAKAREFVESRSIDLPVYHDGPKGLARTLDLPHLPYTYVLDGKGEVVMQYGGAGEAEMSRLRQTLDRLARTRTMAGTTGDGE